MPSGFLIASPASGAGKTTLTLGCLRALRRRGLSVSSFKCGPDYLDPTFHEIATGRPCLNLDTWAMPGPMLDRHLAWGAAGADVVVVEGCMGLFDGAAGVGASGDGSTADIAARLGLPVVLVIDPRGQGQSVGAIAAGFRDFDPRVRLAGVILNNIASPRHGRLAALGLERAGVPVLGVIARGAVPTLPERHLGLVQARELPNASTLIDACADVLETSVDLDGMLGQAAVLTMPTGPIGETETSGQRLAVACDAAFAFVYPHWRAHWQATGTVVLPFSPLADEAPDASADLCWLPGGYPELHAERLAGNRTFLAGLRRFAESKPVYGECGGYMVLGEELIDRMGRPWPMAGLLPVVTSFAMRKLHLGYRAVTLTADTPPGTRGQILRGHEFHYATVVRQGQAEPLGEGFDAEGQSLGPIGQCVGRVSGSFFHRIG